MLCTAVLLHQGLHAMNIYIYLIVIIIYQSEGRAGILQSLDAWMEWESFCGSNCRLVVVVVISNGPWRIVTTPHFCESDCSRAPSGGQAGSDSSFLVHLHL